MPTAQRDEAGEQPAILRPGCVTHGQDDVGGRHYDGRRIGALLPRLPSAPAVEEIGVASEARRHQLFAPSSEAEMHQNLASMQRWIVTTNVAVGAVLFAALRFTG